MSDWASFSLLQRLDEVSLLLGKAEDERAAVEEEAAVSRAAVNEAHLAAQRLLAAQVKPDRCDEIDVLIESKCTAGMTFRAAVGEAHSATHRLLEAQVTNGELCSIHLCCISCGTQNAVPESLAAVQRTKSSLVSA